MGAKKTTLFINEVIHYYFDRDTLLNSTVTGDKSRRQKVEQQPNKLCPTTLQEMRGISLENIYFFFILRYGCHKVIQIIMFLKSKVIMD